MYKKYFLPLLAGALFTTSVSPVQATDTGTISFNGKIVADSCNVNVNGAVTNGIVTFRNLTQTSFGEDKKVGDSQPFKITVRNCDTSISFINIKFSGDRIAGYDDEVLGTTGVANNVGIRMYPEYSSNTFIKFDGTEPPSAAKQNVQGMDVVFNYTAEVIQVGADLPTAGDYSAQATYTLVYR
ncbi:fimbrial protein [Enterobacter sp. SA187]|uniref:fimbrial protein n=1 Tax=Enterobacter sp. SA187 TaxID=1914861 RepID=UPI00093495CC|nr:fimbrial protein [Enterobacter sp. SA187]